MHDTYVGTPIEDPGAELYLAIVPALPGGDTITVDVSCLLFFTFMEPIASRSSSHITRADFDLSDGPRPKLLLEESFELEAAVVTEAPAGSRATKWWYRIERPVALNFPGFHAQVARFLRYAWGPRPKRDLSGKVT